MVQRIQDRSQCGELALIRTLRSRAGMQQGLHSISTGIGDDCAILRPSIGHEVLVTTDFSLEGRHFDRNLHPARSVGHRCLARGLSDLTAMGAKPLAAFLSLALPRETMRGVKGRAWIDGFLDGFFALANEIGTPLAGGDTSAAPGEHVLTDVVLVGSAPRCTALRRSGARAGDLLYVTGSLGGSAAELEQLRAAPRRSRNATSQEDHPHLFPQPRLQAGSRLREQRLASAAIDVSDGLSTDLHHLCDESGVGAIVDAAMLPIHPLARHKADGGLQAALHGGEDYELLFAARPEVKMPRRIGGIAVHCIGRFTRNKQILLRQNGRTQPLEAGGWEHML